MHIEVDYEGAVARCYITTDKTRINFNKASSIQQALVLDAFRTIEKDWERRHKEGGEK